MGLFSSSEKRYDWVCANMVAYTEAQKEGKPIEHDPRACGHRRGVGVGDRVPRGRCNCGGDWVVTDYSNPAKARWWYKCRVPASPRCDAETVYTYAKPPARCPHCNGKRQVVDHHGNDEWDRRRAAIVRAAKTAPVKLVVIPAKLLGWTGGPLLKATGRAGMRLVIDPVTGAVSASAVGKMSLAVRAALKASRCPACGKGLPRSGRFCGRCAPGAAMLYSGIDPASLDSPLYDGDGRNKNLIRYRTADNAHGLEGTRIFPHDPDW